MIRSELVLAARRRAQMLWRIVAGAPAHKAIAAATPGRLRPGPRGDRGDAHRAAARHDPHLGQSRRPRRHLHHPHRRHSTYANGPEILDRHGNVVWFHAIPQGQTAADFRVQPTTASRVLTWWQGTGLGGLSPAPTTSTTTTTSRSRPSTPATASRADGHEFLITPWNTALILAYTTATANLTSIGGPADQTVINGVVQEIDIATGKVLFQWNSADHVPYSQSEQPLPASASTPWDWFHINAVHLDTDGNLLIDARDTWTTYKVNRAHRRHHLAARRQGLSSFKLRGGPRPDARQRRRDLRLAARPRGARARRVHVLRQRVRPGHPSCPYSRAVTVKLDPRTPHRHADRVRRPARGARRGLAGQRPDDRATATCSSAGERCRTSRSSTAGGLVFNAEFPTGVNTYRAYLLPWHSGPARGGVSRRARP